MNLLLLLNLGVEQSGVQGTVFVTSLICVDNLLRVFFILISWPSAAFQNWGRRDKSVFIEVSCMNAFITLFQ